MARPEHVCYSLVLLGWMPMEYQASGPVVRLGVVQVCKGELTRIITIFLKSDNL